MSIYKGLAVGAVILGAANSFAADLYLGHKEVTGSSYYTGTSGGARAEPVPNSQWIQTHSEDVDNLGIRDQGFVIDDSQLNDVVYGIANKLLAEWPGTAPPMVIFVQGDRSPLSYGAQTTYFGEIFIDYGVLLHAESEDELAAVIGHELSHVLLGHGDTLKYKKNVETSLDLVSQGRALFAQAEALKYNDATEEFSVDPSAEGKIKQSAMQKVIADRFYKSAHATLFSRGNEHDADRLALDLMVAAGYSPMGIKASLERMAHSHDISTEVSDYLTGSSQSLLQETLTAVSEALDKDNARAQDMQQFFDNASEDFTDSALDFGKKAIIDFSSRSHPVPSKRVKQITDYLYENYPRSVRRRRPDSESAQAFRAGYVADLVDRYRTANQAVQAIAVGNLDMAHEMSLAALTPPAGSHPYTRYVAFLTSRDTNDYQAAVVNVESADPAMLIPVFASVELAEFLASSGKADRASGMMAQYEGYYGTVAGYYPPKIKLSIADFDLEQAEQLAHACYEVSAPDSPLSKKCAMESGTNRPSSQQNAGSSKTAETLGNFFKNAKK